MNKAIVFNASGARRCYSPSLVQGCPETRDFAKTSNACCVVGGMSFLLGDNVTKASISAAIAELEALLPNAK